MAKTDAIVLGAGIVGVSVALQLTKRGVAVALVDRRGPGEETSYGNAGVIGGAGVFPAAFPNRVRDLMRILFHRAPEANYHLPFLPSIAPWLVAFRAASKPEKLIEHARLMRPLMTQALPEHEMLMRESNAEHYLRRDGCITVYHSDRAFAAFAPELELANHWGVTGRALNADAVRELEPSLEPVFRHAVHWSGTSTVSNPLAVTRAYAARFMALGGVLLEGDARSLHRAGAGWRLETAQGPVDAEDVVVALGPWAPDLLEPIGIRLPLAIKRGYHRHFRPAGNARLIRPVVDRETGYVLAPMERGLRLTSGVEFADRDALPTPVQLSRVIPHAKRLFPLGEPVEAEPWLGRRPCFPDSRPVIGRAPGQQGLWLCYGHGHLGLTLGPASGRLLAEMMTDATPFMDPTPFSADRFE
jgi:D-amino-acid dehydrogenase